MTTNVVIGIFLKDGKFLVEKRLSNDVDAGFISIPGGHVDDGESLEDALIREMKEELELTVKKAKMIFKDMYIAGDGEKQICYYFLITEWEGVPVSKEAEKVFWESDIKTLTTEIDRKAILVALM